MSERTWFVFKMEERKQLGPLTTEEVREFFKDQEFALEDLVFQQGFDNWKPLKDVPQLILPPTPISGPSSPSQIQRPQRAVLEESIVAHNDSLVIKGRLSNISSNGVFLETDQLLFQEGEFLKITIKEGKDLGKPINIRGKITRRKESQPLGYGIQLIDVDSLVQKRIALYVERQQKK